MNSKKLKPALLISLVALVNFASDLTGVQAQISPNMQVASDPTNSTKIVQINRSNPPNVEQVNDTSMNVKEGFSVLVDLFRRVSVRNSLKKKPHGSSTDTSKPTLPEPPSRELPPVPLGDSGPR